MQSWYILPPRHLRTSADNTNLASYTSSSESTQDSPSLGLVPISASKYKFSTAWNNFKKIISRPSDTPARVDVQTPHTPAANDLPEPVVVLSGTETQVGPGTVHPSPTNSSTEPARLVLNARSTVGHGFTNLMGVAFQASDSFVPLKSALGGIIGILKTCEQFSSNAANVESMITRLESFELGTRENPKEARRRSVLQRRIGGILEELGKMARQNKVERIANSAYDEQKLSGYVEDIQEALMDYQVSLQQDLYDMALQTINQVDKLLLDKLPRASAAGFGAGNRQKCLKGTRTSVLAEIEKWAAEQGDHRVYWLNGNAGCGKSTIAQSFAEFCFVARILGGSFFCTRDCIDRSSLHFIFPTLAFQLACRYPAFRKELVKTIAANPDLGHQCLSVQFEKLLVDPLVTTGISTIIVIDALDECKDNEPESAILSLLAQHIADIPSVKFFITGRPEPRIRAGFRLALLQPLTEVFVLHKVERGDVDRDIELYLKTRLSEIVVNRSDIDVSTPWPSMDDVAMLAAKCGRLFICAFTLVKLIASPNHDPQARLRKIISMLNDTGLEGEGGVDQMYMTVLVEGFPDVTRHDVSTLATVRSVVGAIVLIFNPLARLHLATILGMTPNEVLTAVRSPHPVPDIPSSDKEPILVYHKSFPDFVTDSERCTNRNFHIDQSTSHGQLAILCLDLMAKRLKKNICDLPRYSMNVDVKDLSERREEYIGDGLAYACRFWSKHLISASKDGVYISKMLRLLESFLDKHLLAWIELLIIVGDLRSVVYSIHDVMSWLVQVEGGDKHLWKRFEDAQRFVSQSFDYIQISASHLYESALLWAPTSSLTRASYRNHLPDDVKLMNGPETDWDSWRRTIHTGSHQSAVVKFSHSGDLIAAVSYPSLRIYEAITGVCQAAFECHQEHVNSVAFTQHDDFIVTLSGKMVCIWEVQTGVLVQELVGFIGGDAIFSTLSFNGDLVATVNRDEAISVWNVFSGNCQSIKSDGSTDCPIRFICWTGEAYAILSWRLSDGTVKFWDSLTGDCRKVLFPLHNQDVQSFAISRDCTIAAFGSSDGTVTVQNVETCNVIHRFQADVRSAQFLEISPDGRHIVYGEYFGKVVVWNLAEGLKLSFSGGLTHPVSFSFSPSGKIVFGIAEFLKVFQPDTRDQPLMTFDCHSDAVSNLIISSDGRLLVSTSDHTVKLWDVESGSCISTFSTHTGDILRVQMSSDSSVIACSSGYPVHFHVWDVRTRQFIWTKDLDLGSGFLFSPDNRHIAGIRDSSTLTLWDVRSGGLLACLTYGDSLFGDSISFSGLDEVTIIRFSFTPGTKERHQWRICATEENNEFPMVFLSVSGIDAPPLSHMQIVGREYRFSYDSKWIMDEDGKLLCWIPLELRSTGLSKECVVSFGNKVAWGTGNGRVIMLDFSKSQDS